MSPVSCALSGSTTAVVTTTKGGYVYRRAGLLLQATWSCLERGLGSIMGIAQPVFYATEGLQLHQSLLFTLQVSGPGVRDHHGYDMWIYSSRYSARNFRARRQRWILLCWVGGPQQMQKVKMGLLQTCILDN